MRSGNHPGSVVRLLPRIPAYGLVLSGIALFSDAVGAGSLLSGLLAGALMQWLGTTATLGVCGVLSLLAGVVLWIGRRPS
ncbi:hypothetical protein [Promicromonospora sp. NFX87]|uniref:hypothetical protein n=1 Tax=Promicromonospora sp. NFX87 TaxID=3402691 RepID=UPI003AFB13AA